MTHFKNVANFLFEAGILAKTPRSGFHFLGSGRQSVAEHTNRVTYIGYTLAMLEGNVDVAKVMKMCLFHDFAEGRVSDLNYVHLKYSQKDENKAIQDVTQTLPFGEDMKRVIQEYHERKSKEALLVKDADNLEWILSLKEQVDIGNKRALEWINIAIKRLHTEIAKKIVDEILRTDSNEWWFANKDDEWWVNRKQET